MYLRALGRSLPQPRHSGRGAARGAVLYLQNWARSGASAGEAMDGHGEGGTIAAAGEAATAAARGGRAGGGATRRRCSGAGIGAMMLVFWYARDFI